MSPARPSWIATGATPGRASGRLVRPPDRRRRRPPDGRGARDPARPGRGRRDRAARRGSAPAARRRRRPPRATVRARDPLVAERTTASASICVTSKPVRTSTPRRFELTGRLRESSRGKWAGRRLPSQQDDASLRRVERAEIAGEGVAGDLGERAGELDAGRAAADDDEGQRRRRSGVVARARPPRRRAGRGGGSRGRPRASSAPAQRAPLVVAEVGVRGPRGERRGSRRRARPSASDARAGARSIGSHLGEEHRRRSAGCAGWADRHRRCRGERAAVATW